MYFNNSNKSLTNPKKNKKHCCIKKICDASAAAYKMAEEKAKFRARDSRDPSSFTRTKLLMQHLEAVENAEAVVDHNPPTVSKMPYHRFLSSNVWKLRQGKIEVANAKLLAYLARIYNGQTKTGMEKQTRILETSKMNRSGTFNRAIKTMELMQENIKKYEAIKEAKGFYSVKKWAEWYNKTQDCRNRLSRFPNIRGVKPCPLPYRKVMEKAMEKPLQYAYLQVEVEDKRAENLVCELFADMCPFTAKNFQRLCTNTKANSCDCRTYRCKKIDRLHCVQVLDGSYRKLYWVVAEPVDSTVEWTPMMVKENSPLSHDKPGLLSRPIGRAGGVFFITIGPCPILDQYCYIFGRVQQKGIDFLNKMENKNVEENGQLIINMHITDCGAVEDASDVPPPMLLQDFISQVRTEIVPFVHRDAKKDDEWQGGRSAHVENLKTRSVKTRDLLQKVTKEGRELSRRADRFTLTRDDDNEDEKNEVEDENDQNDEDV